jgi:tetratricopeptide (TPR) repeat protein
MSVPAPSIGQVLGHYRVVEKIGAGGMGVVYRAHDELLDRDVALKILPPGGPANDASRKRFRREALALAKLNHPHIAMVFEFGVQDSIDFLVTEYVPGITLDTRLNAGLLPEKEAVRLGIHLAEGLEAAHREGVIHRDLKPGNLRLNDQGELKILDFGLARVIESEHEFASTVTLADANLITGTLPYMAPEQLQGNETDARIDIWAVGAVLYEMVTGKRAFPQRQGPRLIDAILHQAPITPSSLNPRISPALESVILKALDKDPDRRYQSIRELRVDLKRITSGGDHTELTLSPVQLVKKVDRWNRTATGVVLVVVVIGILAALLQRWELEPKQVKQRILAVLPFEALGQDADTGALGVGLTETLTAKLAQLSDSDALQLVSTREIAAQGIKTAEQARREFGTDLVLEGSLQQEGQLIRINCSLVDSKTHRQLGARTFTTAANDIFGLEDQVVSQVLDILTVEIRPEQRRNLQMRPATQAAAYQYYLRGRGYLDEYQKPENVDSSIAEFGHALEVDPNYGLAYAGLGEAYWRGFEQSNRGKDWVGKATENCQKAVAVAPDLAQAHTCLGDVYYGTGHYEKAIEQFQRAVALDSNNEDALRGIADGYAQLGNGDAAETAYRRAIAVRPNYWAGYNWLGTFYFRQSRYADAVGMFRRVVELAPDNFRGYSNLGGIYVSQGHYSDSIEALKRSIELRPTLEAYANLGTAYFGLRRYAESVQICEQALKLDEDDWLLWGNYGDALYWAPGRRHEASRAYRRAISLGNAKLQVNRLDATLLAFLATYYAMLGERQMAFDKLTKAIELAPGDADVRFRAALVYNQFGESDQCLSALEKAVAAGISVSTVRDTPDFDHFQQNRRFQFLLKN